HPADITWKAGLDVLSFGATKNRAMALDAIILFDPSLRGRVEQVRTRGGLSFSRLPYPAAQLLAYVKDDLWLRNARHANQAASALCRSLETLGARAAFAPQGNELFVHMNDDLAERLRKAGLVFRPWPAVGEDAFRFVS